MSEKQLMVMRKDLGTVVDKLYQEQNNEIIIENGVIPNMFKVRIIKYEK